SAQSSRRRRGPKPDFENHAKVAAIVSTFGEDWTADDKRPDLCEKLDEEKVPVPNKWPTRNPPSRTWSRALLNEPNLVIKTIKGRLKAASLAQSTKEKFSPKLSPTSAEAE